MVSSVAEKRMSKVEVTALRDRRLVEIEDCARRYARDVRSTRESKQALIDALLAADALNRDYPRTISDQLMADWVNQGIPDDAQDLLGRPLQMSLMGVRRLTGKAADTRRNRGRR